MLDPPNILPPPGYALLTAGAFGTLTDHYYIKSSDDRYSVLIDIEKRHLNRGSSVHGGMLLNLSDIAHIGAARKIADAASVSTLSLQCDFIGMAGRGWLEASAWVVRKSGALIFTCGEIRAQGALIMTSSGVYEARVGK